MIDVAGGEITFALSIYSHEYLCPKRPSFEFPIGEKKEGKKVEATVPIWKEMLSRLFPIGGLRDLHTFLQRKKNQKFLGIFLLSSHILSVPFYPRILTIFFARFPPPLLVSIVCFPQQTKPKFGSLSILLLLQQSPYFLRIFSVLWKVMIMSTFATKSNATHMLQNTEPDIEVMNCS